MSTMLVGLLAETLIHPGTDQDVGVIDNPVAREAATGYPFIAGSSMKGALKECVGNNETHFGKQDNAGTLLISDARILLLPVRSLTSAYKWVACPLILERLRRDVLRCHLANGYAELPTINTNECLGAEEKGKSLFLEERNFTYAGDIPLDCIDFIKKLISHEDTRNRLSDQLVIVSNDDFTWFANYALPVQARNQLDEKTKSSKNLWYEEYLPADTLMYSVLADRNTTSGGVAAIQKKLADHPYLQVGGNETIGQGCFSLEFYPKEVSHE
jgi:CRISPR-associated protein Cmr4